MAPVYTQSSPGELAGALGVSARAAAAMWRLAATMYARYPGMALYSVSVTLDDLETAAGTAGTAGTVIRGTLERWKAVALATEAVVDSSHAPIAFMFPKSQRPSVLLCIPKNVKM